MEILFVFVFCFVQSREGGGEFVCVLFVANQMVKPSVCCLLYVLLTKEPLITSVPL